MKPNKQEIHSCVVPKKKALLNRILRASPSLAQMPTFSILGCGEARVSRLEKNNNFLSDSTHDSKKLHCLRGHRYRRISRRICSISHPGFQNKKFSNLLKMLNLGADRIDSLYRIFIISYRSYITSRNSFLEVLG